MCFNNLVERIHELIVNSMSKEDKEMEEQIDDIIITNSSNRNKRGSLMAQLASRHIVYRQIAEHLAKNG